MIDLTPLEVRQKKGDFRRSVRGYDPELVNDFLDLVADRMEELVKEAMTLRDRVGGLETDLAAFKDKERALSDALMTAQKLREDARSHAEKEGELLVREARNAAETVRTEIARQIAREEDALRQVRARRSQLVDSFRRLLEREMSELTVIEEALELRTGRGARRKSGAAGASRPAASAAPGPRTEAGASAEGGSAAAAEDSDPTVKREADVQEDWLSSLAEEE